MSPLIYVHSRRGLGLQAVRQRFSDGLESSNTPYGLGLSRSSYHQSFSEDKGRFSLSQKWINKLHFDPLHALLNISHLRKADVVWTMLEWEWLAISLLQRLCLMKKVPVIANSVWMFDHWRRWPRYRKLFYSWLMTNNMILTVHSRAALAIAQEELPSKKLQLTYFGIVNEAFPIRKPVFHSRSGRPLRVYSIGNDRTRDWQTLINALGGLPNVEIRIVCSWAAPIVQASGFSNVKITNADLISSQVENYSWADVVVIPMFDNEFSGITVALEAAACGVPIVSSATGGVPTYFSPDEVVYVEPKSIEDLRQAVLGLTEAASIRRCISAQSRFVVSDYSSSGMVNRYLQLSEL